jgi:hypothetical protein
MGEGEIEFPALVYSVNPGIPLHELELEFDPYLTELVPEHFGQLGKTVSYTMERGKRTPEVPRG